jgi:LysR family transcriptional activator of nhaA
MEWLNYHHLLYFWVVAKEGSIVRAGKQLGLAPPTISGQLHQLEEALGEKLFSRKGRNLVLTDEGRVALRYADAIFALGREFVDTVRGRATGQEMRLTVGVSDVLAKSVVHRMLKPVFAMHERIRVVCQSNRSNEAFLADLALNRIDVLLADAPAGPGTPVRVFSHPLGECGVAFFAAPALAASHRRGFPHSLDGVPFVLPGSDSTLRRALNEWFATHEIHPEIVAEMDDAALAAVMGEAGLGVFAAPDVIEADIRRRYRVRVVGRAREIVQRFYVISLERKIQHPAVAALSELARTRIFD